MWTCEEVYERLREHRQVKAKKLIVRGILQHATEGEKSSSVLFQLERLEQTETRVTGWLELLTTEQRFIVETHLIDGLDWARTIVEYDKKLGIENGRSERTMKRIQAKAVKHIVDCLNKIGET